MKWTTFTRILCPIKLYYFERKEIAYYTNTVNWDSVSIKTHAAAKSPAEISDLKPALEILLNELRDSHGQFRETTNYSIIAHFTDYKNARHKDDRVFESEVWSIVNDFDSRYEHALSPNKIGYLKLVGIGTNLDGKKEAERIKKFCV
ncbi:MAG: hypothetical protein GQ574_23150 [Crocinitomix sp.]|nr:hypothetical protein [Crocinitomix sp.]